MAQTIHERFMTINPEILHGTPVFRGTRVPLDTLFDYLETGETIYQFLEDFPTVSEIQVKQLLEYSKRFLINEDSIG